MHRRMHEDNAFWATAEECALVYPEFHLDIDDSEDCVLPCTPALPNSGTPDFVDPGHTQLDDPPAQGMAFGVTTSSPVYPVPSQRWLLPGAPFP